MINDTNGHSGVRFASLSVLSVLRQTGELAQSKIRELPMIAPLPSNAMAMPKASDGTKAINRTFDQNMVCGSGMSGS